MLDLESRFPGQGVSARTECEQAGDPTAHACSAAFEPAGKGRGVEEILPLARRGRATCPSVGGAGSLGVYRVVPTVDATHAKFAASSVLPVPFHFAT